MARQSGDEFLLLLGDLASGPAVSDGSEAALAVVEERALHVHELLTEPFTLDGVDFTISASLGISVFPRDAIDGKSMLSHADVAMYRSKGRTRRDGGVSTTERTRCAGSDSPRSSAKPSSERVGSCITNRWSTCVTAIFWGLRRSSEASPSKGD